MNTELLQQAERLQRARKWVDALEVYKSIIKSAPSAAEAYQGAADCLRALGRYAEALDATAAATRLAPSLYQPHVTRAYVFLRTDKVKDAAEEAQVAFSLAPESAAALECYGTTLLVQGKIEESISILNRAVRADSHSVFAVRNLAFAYNRKKDRQQYLESMLRLFGLRPSLEYAVDLLSAVLGRFAVALALLICAVTYGAYVVGARWLILIPFLYLIANAIVLVALVKRKDWMAARELLVLIVFVAIPTVYLIMR